MPSGLNYWQWKMCSTLLVQAPPVCAGAAVSIAETVKFRACLMGAVMSLISSASWFSALLRLLSRQRRGFLHSHPLAAAVQIH